MATTPTGEQVEFTTFVRQGDITICLCRAEGRLFVGSAKKCPTDDWDDRTAHMLAFQRLAPVSEYDSDRLLTTISFEWLDDWSANTTTMRIH